MSKKTLYELYATKKEVIGIITTEFLDEQVENYRRIREMSSNAVEELLLIMDSVRSLFENLDIKSVYELQKYYYSSWESFLHHKEKIILVDIKENLRRGMKEGLYRKDIDVDIIGRMRLEQVEMALDPGIFNSEEYNITEVNQELLIHYLYGICTPKGLEVIESIEKEKSLP